MNEDTPHIRYARFASLQSLRGLFAIFIFFHHLSLFPAGGDSGVAFFIVLSGFVMSAGYSSKFESGALGYRQFLLKRIRRLYPYHIIGFVMAILLMNTFYGAATPLIWGINLAMIQSWIPKPVVYFSCDAPSWCLSDLFFCYAMFPFLTRLFSSRKRTLLTIGTLSVLYFPAVICLPKHLWDALIYINPLFRLSDFLIGMGLWSIFFSPHSIKQIMPLSRLSYLRKSIIEGMTILFVVLFYLVYPYIPSNFSLVAWWWLPTLAIIFIFSSLDNDGGMVSRILQQSWAVKFGELSFAFYMLHIPIIIGYERLMETINLSPEINVISISGLFLITLSGAMACERMIRNRRRGG